MRRSDDERGVSGDTGTEEKEEERNRRKKREREREGTYSGPTALITLNPNNHQTRVIRP